MKAPDAAGLIDSSLAWIDSPEGQKWWQTAADHFGYGGDPKNKRERLRIARQVSLYGKFTNRPKLRYVGFRLKCILKYGHEDAGSIHTPQGRRYLRVALKTLWENDDV